MVPFEIVLVSSYRPSIVTFLLSLRVSEILPLLCSSTPFFSIPPLVSPKFLHVPLGLGGYDLWATNSEGVGLIVGANSFQDFQPVWSWSTNVTDRQTDRRTDRRHAIARPRFALKCIARWKHTFAQQWRMNVCPALRLSVHKERARKLDLDRVVDHFVEIYPNCRIALKWLMQ